jgi:LEA14-like dessication related protein
VSFAKEIPPMVRSLILLTVAALSLVGCANLPHTDPPNVTLVGIDPSEGEGLEARMQLTLRVQNPNSAPIEYNGIYLELDVLNKSLASGVSNESGTVPPFGEAVIHMPMTVSILGIVGGAMSVLSGKPTDKITYALRGKFNTITYGELRFKSQGELTLPTSQSATGDATAGPGGNQGFSVAAIERISSGVCSPASGVPGIRYLPISSPPTTTGS